MVGTESSESKDEAGTLFRRHFTGEAERVTLADPKFRPRLTGVERASKFWMSELHNDVYLIQ